MRGRRRTLMYASLASCVFLTLVVLFTIRSHVGYWRHRTFYALWGGAVAIEWLPQRNSMEPHWRSRTHDGSFVWWPYWIAASVAGTVVVPFWPLIPATLSISVWLWWRDRRIRPGHCAVCGYDLAGLALGAVCPECGGAVAGDSPRALRLEKSP